jgi:c-di-GMP-binding flagellar brake protein YcgR
MKQGTRVEVKSFGDSSPYITTVESVIEKNNCVLLDIMRTGGVEVRLSSGKPYVLRFFSDRGVFKFTCVMRGYIKKGHFDYMLFNAADDGEKIQRRQAFRFNCGIPVSFSIIYSSGQQAGREDGLISDLSAGGAKIFTNKNLHTGYLLNISIPLGEGLVVAFGDVRTKTELPSQSKYHFQYGIRFAMMPESDQEQIIRFMYKMQREELKKARPR